MAGVFAKKSIFVLIVGGGWGRKTRFEGVVGLKRFVGNDGGCGYWSGPKFWGKNDGEGGGKRLLLLLLLFLLLLLLPSRLNVSSFLSLFSLELNSRSIMSGASFKILCRSFFLPMFISFIKLPIARFCKSLKKNSIGFWFLMTFLETRSSFLLKVALFNFWSIQ